VMRCCCPLQVYLTPYTALPLLNLRMKNPRSSVSNHSLSFLPSGTTSVFAVPLVNLMLSPVNLSMVFPLERR
jgi:hypothetical protein